jgi:FkbM family methyltransferase
MKTVSKIAIARTLHRVVRLGRSIAGNPDKGTFTRRGIVYDLDLSQGIDFAIYLGGTFERSTATALERLVLPSSLELDIGANIGAHTLHLAQLVGPQGKVIAFEPTNFAFSKLKRNLELNPTLGARVEVRQCFLTRDDQIDVPTNIYSSWPLAPEPGLHAKHLGRPMRTEAAIARSLDSILNERQGPKVDLIKLDVDGFECDVLRGATAMLRDAQPVFVMELAPYVLEESGSSLDELLSFFIPHGYAFYNESNYKLLPSNATEPQRSIADGESINVIARPG